MTTKKVSGGTIGIVAVAIILIGVAAVMFNGSSAPADDRDVAGQRGGLQEFADGATLGGATVLWAAGTIPSGSNQVAWCNNKIGKTVYVDHAEIRALSGTASSSILLHTGTSTATTVADYVPPPGDFRIIDGATFATSTPYYQITAVGTTTSNGRGQVALAARDCFVFSVQERYACKSVGQCETATSSNRGIGSYGVGIRIHY